MKAAVLVAANDIRYMDIPDPVCGDGEVLVRVAAAGICGSDIPRVLQGRVHSFPIVLGHEFSGVVETVGKNVTTVRAGNHVAGVPLLPCGTCEACQRGDFALCPHYSFIGSRINGAFAEYIALPEHNVVRMDASIPLQLGVFFETSSVALHALRHSQFQGGRNVVILGSGTIGIFVLQWAKILGAAHVAVIGRHRERLQLATHFGADAVFSTLDDDYLKQALEFSGGRGFDYVFEAAGSTETMQTAFPLGAQKAKICFIGTPRHKLCFDAKIWEHMNRKEFSLTGSWMSYSAPFPGEEWLLTSQYLSNAKLRFEENMVHDWYPLQDAAQAFEVFRQQIPITGRIILLPSLKKY